MLLDAKLEIAITSHDTAYMPIVVWDCPRLYSQNDSWDRYYPIAQDTPLHFGVDIPDNLLYNQALFIDLYRSTLQLGYHGYRDDWIGPGRLFNYNLLKYFPDYPTGYVPINKEI